MLNLFESQRRSIETHLRQLLNSDLPQVHPFLNTIGLTSRSNDVTPSNLSYDEISSIWYWFGVWDPVLQLMEKIAINSWLKQLLFKKALQKIQFIRNRYENTYEMRQSFYKTYNTITWFTRHLLIAKFVFKMNIMDIQILNTQFLSTFYYRFLGYFSSMWFELLFHIDIYAPTLPLFLDNLENDKNKIESISMCAHLADIIYGPQNMTFRFIRQLRWMILPDTMSNTLKQYSYSQYNQFITQQLQRHGFILQYLGIGDTHLQLQNQAELADDSTASTGGALSYMIVLHKATNDLFVVFRGTELVADLYHDMFFSDVLSSYSNISVHAGYYSALFGSGTSHILAIEENINKILMQHPTIQNMCFTGHSMGGALACLCGIELLARGQLVRTAWYDESKSIYHHKAQISSSSSEDKNKKNVRRLFKEYMKLSQHDSTFYDERELHQINVEFVTFGAPGCISSSTENSKLQRLQPPHDVYTSSYFHDHAVHIVHEYDPIPILSFGTYGLLRRHFLTWFTKGHLNKYFQPAMITLGSVITESSLGLDAKLSTYLGFNTNNTDSNVLFGRFLICIAIHQMIRNKILHRMSKSIYNHINYSSFHELDKINKSLYKTIGYKYLNFGINALLYPTIFYLMDHGFLDYGIWKSLSLRLIATRFCVSAITAIWNNMSLIVRDFYEASTYFPIPNKSGKYMVLIPEDDVLYGTHLRTIKSTTGLSYFKAMRKAVQPYTWVTVHNQQNYCKCIDRITTLEDYNTESVHNKHNKGMSSMASSEKKSRRNSIQLQQQIIAEVSMFPNTSFP